MLFLGGAVLLLVFDCRRDLGIWGGRATAC